MGSLRGGYNFVDGCYAYSFAVVTLAGAPINSPERYILSQLAFNYCVFG